MYSEWPLTLSSLFCPSVQIISYPHLLTNAHQLLAVFVPFPHSLPLPPPGCWSDNPAGNLAS